VLIAVMTFIGSFDLMLGLKLEVALVTRLVVPPNVR